MKRFLTSLLLAGLAPLTVAPLVLAPAALAQTPAKSVPEVKLDQQDLGAWGGPTFWIRNDLLLLGRAAGEDTNASLWFWSPGAGAFDIAIPASVPTSDRPNSASICPNNGKLQWLGQPLDSNAPRNTMPPSALKRRVYALDVDPVTKSARLDAKQTLDVIRLTEFYRVNLMARDFRSNPAAPGVYYIRHNETCATLDTATVAAAFDANPAFAGTTAISIKSGVPNGGWRIEWRAPSTSSGAAGPYPGPIQEGVMSHDFSTIIDTKDIAAAPLPGERNLRLVTLTETGPLLYQLQLQRADGQWLGLASPPADIRPFAQQSPDGCLLLTGAYPTQRLDPSGVYAQPPPPPSDKLAKALEGRTLSMTDLCSPANVAAMKVPAN